MSAASSDEAGVKAMGPAESGLLDLLRRDWLPRLPDHPRITGLSVQQSEFSSWYATYRVEVALSTQKQGMSPKEALRRSPDLLRETAEEFARTHLLNKRGVSG